MTASGPVMLGTYNYGIVILSVLISILAASAALDLAGRVAATRGKAMLAWLIGGATASGIGTWSMHFTAMRAFSLPVPVEYDWPTVLVSLLPGVFGSAVAIFVVSRPKVGLSRLLAGGVLVGGGIAAMHYTAMAAMRMPGMCHYSPLLVTLSVVVAILLSVVPLKLTLVRPDASAGRELSKAVSVLLLGSANPVMHFTGMAATTFTGSQVVPDLSHAVSISTIGLRVFTIIPLLVLTVALATSLADRLQKESALLDELFEQAPEAVVLTDHGNKVLRVNSEFTRVFGYAAQETISRQLEDLIVPDESRNEFQKQFDPVVKLGQRLDTEGVLRRRDGNPLHASIIRVPVALPGGQSVIYAILRDITKRKQAEDALRDSEERFRTIFENAGVGIALVDLKGHVIKSNPTLRQILGYSEEEFSSMVFTEFTHPSDRVWDWEHYSELAAGKRDKYEIEKRYLKKGGGVLWGLLVVSLIKDEDDRPMYALSMVEDISERKRAEEALRDSEERYRTLFERNMAGVYRTTLDGRILECNQAMANILGFSSPQEAKEFRGQDNYFSEEERAQFIGKLEANGNLTNFEVRRRRKDGSPVWLIANLSLITQAPGGQKILDGTFVDITERKRAEKELQKSRDKLRALAAHLQRIREEERTRVAREIHDELGQALTAIKINLSSLISKLPADGKTMSESILKLVDETIQSVRRIATELRPVVLDELGLVAAVEWASEEFQARAGIKCRTDLPHDDVDFDPERATALFRIFQETLTNVARHANATEVNVRLAKEDGNLILEVHDNGTGASKEQLSAPSSLGILGMRERALLLAGEFTITSSAAEGTSVRVRIPDTDSSPPREGK